MNSNVVNIPSQTANDLETSITVEETPSYISDFEIFNSTIIDESSGTYRIIKYA